MNIYLIVIAFALIVVLVFVIGKLLKVKEDLQRLAKIEDRSQMNSSLAWYIYTAVGATVLAIVCAFGAPYYFTDAKEHADFLKTGAIGDTVGGLMNPFIAIAGVIVTGLAFWMQYEANAQQRKLFLIEQKQSRDQFQKQIDKQDEERQHQQFESQFYEMIRLHRENVSEMRIEGYDFEEDGHSPLKKVDSVTTGKKVFVTMKTELEVILKICKKVEPLSKTSFILAYELFFGGLDKFRLKHPSEAYLIVTALSARAQHQYPGVLGITTNHDRKQIVPGIDLNFNYKPFSGHASRLGHYFRHLYLAVKSVVNSNILRTDDEKMRYLRLLRAQLSNHEQILLFYNWLSDYGEKWEDGEHHFFAKYNMIHNLWYDELEADPFIESSVQSLRNIATGLGNDDIFEID